MVVAFYMTSALTMVFVNKAVLISAPTLPITFLLAQLSISVLLLHVSAFLSPNVAKDIPRWDQVIPQIKEKWRGLWKVVSVNAIGLLFNTLCLRDVDASFFQIARGLVLPLTIITSCICIRARPSLKTILAALGVTCGFLIGVAPSISPLGFRDIPLHALASSFTAKLTASPLSLFYGVLSSLFIALHAVWIKSSLPTVDNSAISLAWWSNAAGVVILLPLALINGELSALITLITGADASAAAASSAKTFLIGSLVTGFVGFFLCIASLISIKVTSPITHMFSSAARSVLQTLLGTWIFGDILTVNRALSIFTILLGTMYYTWVKSRESAAHSPTPPKDRERDLERGNSEDTSTKEGFESIPLVASSPTSPGSPKREITTIWEAPDEKEDRRKD